MLGQAQEIDEEGGGDGRSQRIGHHLRDIPDEGGHIAQRFAIAHLQELPEGECAGGAVAVEAEAGQRDEQPGRHPDDVPEAQRIADLVVLLNRSDQRDHAQSGGDVTHADDVPPRHSAGRQEVRDSADIFAGVDCHRHDDDKGNDRDTPVYPMHECEVSGDLWFWGSEEKSWRGLLAAFFARRTRNCRRAPAQIRETPHRRRANRRRHIPKRVTIASRLHFSTPPLQKMEKLLQRFELSVSIDDLKMRFEDSAGAAPCQLRDNGGRRGYPGYIKPVCPNRGDSAGQPQAKTAATSPCYDST